MRLIATCPEETKEALVKELTALGATAIAPGFRAVDFEATEELFYELHLKVRTPSRILKVLKDVPAKTPAMLASQARRIPWHQLFDVHHGFMVEALGADGTRGRLRAIEVITKVRESIQDSFERQQGQAPQVDLENPKVVVVAYVADGRCVLSLDTSGKSLHKRGYREQGHPAVIKETLAASLLILAGYDGSQAFLDPMCGSGTIAIEAALMGLRKAPQLLRKKGGFSFEWQAGFNRELWRQTQERVRAEKLEERRAPIAASDINPVYVEIAKKSALSARVERYMDFATARFQDVEPPAPTGILVTNLPYGERLETAVADFAKLYEEIGDTLKRKFGGWRAAILAAEASPYKFIGLKPSRRIPILNGSIPCKLLIFDIYAGSKRHGDGAPGAALT